MDLPEFAEKFSARTLHRFIRRHEGRMAGLFIQVVQLAMKMGLAKLGRIAIDGTRLKANTSKHKAMSHDRMNKAVEQLKNELNVLVEDLASIDENEHKFSELPDEIKHRQDRLKKIASAKAALEAEKGEQLKDKDQKSFNDHDALPMAGKGKTFEYGYNAQAAVDEDSQIVVGCTVYDNQCDSGAVESVLVQVEQNCNESASEVLVDAAYNNGADLKSIENTGATAYAAIGKGENADLITVDDQLTAGIDPHEYSCQAGKMLPVRYRNISGSTQIEVPVEFCSGCPFQGTCKLFAKNGKIYTVRPRDEWKVVQANRKRMRGDGRGVFKRRKVIVEPVFGNVKTKNLKILVTGKRKVSTWWTMVCLMLNLEKIVKHLAQMGEIAVNDTFLGTATCNL